MTNEPCSLPADWNIVPLKELIDFETGRTPSRAKADYWSNKPEEGVPWVSIADMKPYGRILNTSERITSQALNEVFHKRISPKGTLLMSFKLTIGRVATLAVNACHNEAIISIYPKSINQKYLEYYLSQVNYADYQDRAVKGNTLNQEKINRIAVNKPPAAEQQKIASLLWKVQQSIEIEEKLIATVYELKESAMQKMFSSGLYEEEKKDTDLGPIPKSWDVLKISDKAKLIAGGTPSRAESKYWIKGTIPWVKTGEVDYCIVTDTEEKITPEGMENSSAKLLPAGTLLVAMYGQGITRGKVAILGIEATTNQACVGLIRKKDDLIPKYLYYYLSHSYERLRSLSHGAQQQNLNKELVGSFQFPFPKMKKEQEEIVHVLEAIDQKIAIHTRKRQSFEDLFKTLLHQLMAGQIRITDLQIDTSDITS